jgi:hypothetical protein
MKKRWATLIAAALVATGTAQAGGNPIQGDPITAKVDAPVFLGPATGCPEGRVHTRLLSVSGAVIGSSLLCVSSVAFDEATATLTEAGVLTLYLAGGTIVTTATIIDALGGYPIVTQTISGAVLAGTGLYLGATGTLSGGGTIVFDENGVPHPDSTLVVDLD